MSLNSFTKHDHGGPQSYDQLLDRDGRGEQPHFRLRGDTDIGPLEVPTAWYLDREIHELEVERLWKRVWQVACREDDLAVVGDTWVYDIAGVSILIVRASETEIKAYYNACLHRSVTLRVCPGRVNNIQCPFHGFTWSLHGELKMVPCPEQFPQVRAEEFRLPEVRVDTWGGFVFVNLDPDAPPLEEFLGTFGREFARAPLERRVKTLHVQKVVPANWKATQEAFMEGYHVLTTHPQNIPIASDQCTQHDVFGHYSRGILGRGVPSEYMSQAPDEQSILDVGLGRWADEEPLPPLRDGQTARERLADIAREKLRERIGDEADMLTEADLVDTIYYTLFPNFHPFSSLVQPMVYLFRPYGDDHTRCLIDIIFLVPCGSQKPEAGPVEIKFIAEDEPFTKVPELGFLGPFLNQDISNLSQIMKGMRNNQRKRVVFARQHELKIRHFYHLYEKMMGLTAAAGLGA